MARRARKKISIRSLKRQYQAWGVRTRNQLDSEISQAIGEEIKALYTKTLDSDEAIAEQLSARKEELIEAAQSALSEGTSRDYGRGFLTAHLRVNHGFRAREDDVRLWKV